MSVRTDVINLNVNVNSNAAQNELNNLRKRAAEVKLEMEGLGKRTKEFAEKKKELAGITAEMAKLKQQIGITALSQKELVAELNKLKALKGSVVPFSNEFKELDAQIKKVEGRLYNVKNGVQGFASFFSKIKDEVKQFGVLAVGYLGFQFITSSFQNIIRSGARLSDQLADIRRVTGLTAEEAAHLNSELNKLNTRTSTEGLRQIAVIAGKLGVAKNDLLSFTAAVDQLQVALGDELGNADQITEQLGKILNVFDKEGKVTGDNLLRAGNAIVDLANKGVASGAFMVDFTQRLAGLAKTANLSLESALGLGAGLEELGQRSESSSTAIIKVLSAIGTDVPKFAKIAGLSVLEFTKILREKPEEALIKVSEALVKGKVGFDEISAAFSAAGEDGARVVTTLGVIGGKAEFFRDKISDAGKALKNTNEIQEAFALKNETFGATLDKLGKEFNKLVTSSAVTNFLKGAIEGAVSFINAIKNLPQFIADNRTAIIALIGVTLTYIAVVTKSAQATLLSNAAKVLEAITDRAKIIITGALTLAKAAYGVVVDLVTGKVRLATVAQQVWNTVLKANPLGVIIGIITAAAVVVSALTNKVKELTTAQKLSNEIQKSVTENTAEEIEKIKILSSVVKDNAVTLDNRKKALQALININPQYLGGLTLENIKTKEGTDLIAKYITSLKAKAEAEATYALYVERLKKKESDFSTLRSELGDKTSTDAEFETKVRRTAKNTVSNKDGNFRNALEKKQPTIAGVDINGLLSTIDEIKILEGKVTASAKQNVQTALGGTTQVVANANQSVIASNKQTISSLEKQKGDLETIYKEIDITNLKALKENQAQRKKIQAQIDSIEGKQSTGQKKEQSEYDRLKKEADKFYNELLQLKKKAQIKGQEPEQAEITAVANKYAELTAKAKQFFLDQVIDRKRLNEELTLLEKAKQEELAILFEKNAAKIKSESDAAEYEKALAKSQEFFDNIKIQQAKAFADGKLTKQQYDNSLKKLDADLLQDRINHAVNYSDRVKKAAEDVKNFRKQQEKQTTQDLIEETENRKAISDSEKLSRAQRGVITSRGKGIDAELQAKKDLIKLQFDLDTQYLDKKSEAYQLADAQLNEASKDAEREATLAKIEQVLQYVDIFQGALNSLNTIITNNENRQLAKEKRIAEGKKKDLKKQFDDKLISQSQFDKKTQAIDEAQQKSEAATKRKQAEREKALNIFNAVISNASAIVKTMASVPFPFNIPLAIAQGIAGGLQIAAIKNTPLPELGMGDWIRNGDKHKDASGGIPVMIERDEAVMNAAAMNDKEVVNVTGTTAQITSALNSRRGGGTAWAGGAVVSMPKWRTEKSAQINPGLVKYMATGGLAGSAGSGDGSSPEKNEMADLLKKLIVKQEEQTQEIKNMKTKLHAVVSIKEYRQEEAKYDAAQKASGIAS